MKDICTKFVLDKVILLIKKSNKIKDIYKKITPLIKIIENNHISNNNIKQSVMLFTTHPRNILIETNGELIKLVRSNT